MQGGSMKSLVKKLKKAPRPVRKLEAPRLARTTAQCCAKVSRNVAGCHD